MAFRVARGRCGPTGRGAAWWLSAVCHGYLRFVMAMQVWLVGDPGGACSRSASGRGVAIRQAFVLCGRLTENVADRLAVAPLAAVLTATTESRRRGDRLGTRALGRAGEALHRRGLPQLPRARRGERRAGPRRVRRQLRPARTAQGQIRPDEPVPHEPQHRTCDLRGSVRRALHRAAPPSPAGAACAAPRQTRNHVHVGGEPGTSRRTL
jgi:hypothetical protein